MHMYVDMHRAIRGLVDRTKCVYSVAHDGMIHVWGIGGLESFM